MAKARIKKQIFDKCDITLIQKPGRVSHYSGGLTNLWLRASVHGRNASVYLNGYWWTIDPSDWETNPVDFFNDIIHKPSVGTGMSGRDGQKGRRK